MWQRLSIVSANVQELQKQLRAREKSLTSSTSVDEPISSSTSLSPPQSNQWQKDTSIRVKSPDSFSADRPSSTLSTANGMNPKFPKRRPVFSAERAALDRADSPLSNEVSSRPSSTSSSGPGSNRPSQLPPPSDGRRNVGDAKVRSHKAALPKANVIEPALLLSYLTYSQSSRPSILLLDVRPKEQYERGCLNADNVVWIDPILLDEE